jgi:hypothetical protein
MRCLERTHRRRILALAVAATALAAGPNRAMSRSEALPGANPETIPHSSSHGRSEALPGANPETTPHTQSEGRSEALPGAWRPEVPPRSQAQLLLRALAYDRNVAARASYDVLTVIVAFRPRDAQATQEANAVEVELEDAARGALVSGLKVRVVAVPWHGVRELAGRLASEHAAAVYVANSLSDEVPAISAASREHGALTFAPTRDMVFAGLALGFVNRGQRTGVLVNLAAARAEGADLDSAFLAVAEIADKR